jgi:trimeric autotransporter adhesin
MTRIRSFTMACRKSSLVWMVLCASVMGMQSIEMRAQNVETPPRITAAVDNAVLTTLKGNTPFQARAAYDHGALPDSTPAGNMLIVLKRSNMQEMQLRQTMSDLHNPASASYHKWLKPSEFAQQFGPADQDVQAVSNWLASQGFTVNKTSKGKTALQFSGTAGQVRNAFHTELHTYVRNGVTFHSNNQDPQIPSALAPVVSGIAALNDIKPQSLASILGTASFNPKTHATVPQWSYPVASGGVFEVLAPGDFAVQYDVNPVYQAGNTGSGETIGILESDADIDNAVVSNYRNLFGFSTANLPTTIVDGNDPAGDFSGEAYLDVEVSGSVAPDAKVLMYTSGSTLVTTGLYSAAIRAVDDDAADVISVSYGECELGLSLSGNLFWNNVWSQAAAQGQSVFVSAGDSGPASCGETSGLTVSGIASTPYNVAVGGTDFYYSDYNQGQAIWQPQLEQYWNLTASTTPVISILKPVPEQPWNDAFGLNVGGDDPTSIGGGGGGASNCIVGTESSLTGDYISCSAGYPKPSWQTGTGVPKDGVRDIPDVSLFAANGLNFSYWPICAAETDCTAANLDSTGAVNITGVGGTSATAPAMAGIMALIDQAQKGRQGNPNYVLYALAAQAPTAFHDVTVGSNNQPCDEGTTNCSLDTNGDGYYSLQEYPAGVGYDLATGLGSVDANVLLTNWNKVTFQSTATDLTLSSTSFAHGTPVTATATVASSGGTPTGSVSLVNATTAASAGVGTIALTSGTGQASLTSLPAGTYDLVAQYGGDGTFAASTSAPVSVTVTPENSAVTVTAQYFNDYILSLDTLQPITNGTTLQYGDAFVFDVKVYGASSSAAAPDGVVTGVVTVTDNGSPITTLNLNSYGVAELTTGALAVGTHSLVFSYGGDGSFNASKSTALTFTVTMGVPALQFSGSVPPSIPVNGTLLVPFFVSANSGTLPVGGTVTVNFGSQSQTVPMTQARLVGTAEGYGTATFNVGATPGTYALTATYSGDANLQPVSDTNSISSIIVGTGLLTTTTTTETPSVTAANPDNALTITVKVTTTGTHIPTGSVSLYSNAYPISPLAPLDATGTVVVSEPNLVEGPVQWVAIYYGDQYNAPSESAPVTVNDTTADFTLTSGSPAVSINSGSTTGSTTVSVSSLGPVGLTGMVALQCATSSPNLTCALSNSSLTLPTSPTQLATTTITFTAVPPASAKLDSRGRWLGGGATLALLAFLMPVRRRARRLVRLLALLLLANVGLLGMSGCSGGQHPTTPTSPTTPAPTAAGNYTATITATSASNGIIHNLQVRVTVEQ